MDKDARDKLDTYFLRLDFSDLAENCIKHHTGEPYSTLSVQMAVKGQSSMGLNLFRQVAAYTGIPMETLDAYIQENVEAYQARIKARTGKRFRVARSEQKKFTGTFEDAVEKMAEKRDRALSKKSKKKTAGKPKGKEVKKKKKKKKKKKGGR